MASQSRQTRQKTLAAESYVHAGYWDNETLADHLQRWVQRTPDKVVAIDRYESLTYAELGRRAHRLASALLALGIRKGDVVAYQLPSWTEALVLDYACASVGAIICPIVYLNRAHEVRHALTQTEASIFFVPVEFRGFNYAEMALEVQREIPTLKHVIIVAKDGQTVPTGMKSFADMLDTEWEREIDPALFATERPSAHDVAAVMFSSGTTAMPKGVMHTHNTLGYGGKSLAAACGLTSDDVFLNVAPVGVAAGNCFGFYASVFLGAKVALLDVWTPQDALKLIERERCTLSLGPTAFPLGIVRAVQDGEPFDVSSLRVWLCGGAPIPRELIAEAQSVGFRMQGSLGSTECLWYTMHRTDTPDEKLSTTDGYPAPGHELRVVDDDGHEVPVGQPGEILTRGPMECVGYWPSPELNESGFTEDGFWRSGDLVVRDDEGFVRVVGRKKDMIIRGGFNIAPAEVEALLLSNPKITQVAVVGMPDLRLGERACAYIVPRGGETVTLDEVIAYLKGKGLATPKLPERVVIREALPATAQGKVLKYALREEIAKQVEQEAG